MSTESTVMVHSEPSAAPLTKHGMKTPVGTCGVGAPCGPLPAGDVAVLHVTAVRGTGSLDALEIV